LALETDALHWSTIKREWREGDHLTLTLPAKFSLSPLRGVEGKFPTAIMRGPVTMAMRPAEGNSGAHVDFDNLESGLVASPGEPLTYHLAARPSVLVRPYYSFRENEPYHMYLHPDVEGWVAKWKCDLSDGWSQYPWYCFSTRVGATARHEFEGTGIRWTGFRFEDGGKAEVSIDGQPVAVIDQYGPAHLPSTPPRGPAIPFEWEHKGLAPGKHTLSITVLLETNEDSKGQRITISEVVPV
jgi:hypothetical protein